MRRFWAYVKTLAKRIKARLCPAPKREFLFVHGKVWVLKDSEELAVARLDRGDMALLVFSDDDLATTYAERNRLIGKMATVIEGNRNLVNFLISVKGHGVTHLVIDHTFGKQSNSISIDKAIVNAEQAANS